MKILSDECEKISESINKQIKFIENQSSNYLVQSKEIIENILNAQTQKELNEKIQELNKICYTSYQDDDESLGQFEFNNKINEISYVKFKDFVKKQVEGISKKVKSFSKQFRQQQQQNDININCQQIIFSSLYTFDEDKNHSKLMKVKSENDSYFIYRGGNKCTMDVVISDQSLTRQNHKFGIKFLHSAGSNQCLGIIEKQKAIDCNFTLPNYCRDLQHGAYLMNFTGGKYVYCSSDADLNDQKLAFEVQIGEQLICEYNQTDQVLIFKKYEEDPNEFNLPIDTSLDKEYHPCVVLCCQSEQPQVEFYNIID